MSVQAISWALSVKTGDPSAKVVLVALANYADDRGRCWPAQSTIAEQTEQSVDTVQRRIKDLENLGLLQRMERPYQNGKKGGLYFYHLLLPDVEATQNLETMPQVAVRSKTAPQTDENHTANSSKPCRTVAALTTILEPSVDNRQDASKVATAFEDFWKAYPKRQGSNPKAPAHKKFSILVASGVNPAIMITGAANYATELRRERKDRTQYVAQAITWLNQSRFDDYQTIGTDNEQPRSGGLVEAGRKLLAQLEESRRFDGVGREPAGSGGTGNGAGNGHVRMLPER